MVGICGGFTTFSAFSLDVVLLWQRGDHLLCAGYTVASFVGAVLGLMAGLALMRNLLAA